MASEENPTLNSAQSAIGWLNEQCWQTACFTRSALFERVQQVKYFPNGREFETRCYPYEFKITLGNPTVAKRAADARLTLAQKPEKKAELKR
jgi:hypothetical protein